ncbi:MAG: S8 family serine peptidase [bacterium]|nr:S8 family serine peptidase [bacterium]
MKQRRFSHLLLACLLFTFASAHAAYEIYFLSGTVTPQAHNFSVAQIEAGQHVVLQFFDPLSVADHERLESAGVSLVGYLPERAFAAFLKTPLTDAQLERLGVRAVLAFAPEYKLHPRCIEQEFGPWSEFGDGRRMFNVDVFSDVKLADAAAVIQGNGFEVGDYIEVSHTLIVAADPGKLVELAALDPVLFVNEMSPPLESLNATVRTRLHVNEVQTNPYNLSGEGVTILVYDGGLVDATHPDFGTRVNALEDGTVQDHPTHVAGTVGGDGTNSGGTNRGMAPDAVIISGEYDACIPFCFYNSPNDVSPDYILARTGHNIELTTNSMGANVSPNGYPCSWFGDYELTSRILDDMVRHTVDRPLTMFWAAGNERGDAGCNVATYRCMSIPASAKNIMTIGATTATDAVASFSSFGPTDDGRVKPEVVATGVNVNSCAPGGGYQTMSGTSMATPASAGVACLILEQWHTQFPGAPDPLPETMKALLINSATDLGNAGPDFQTGYGIVHAQRAVDQLAAGGVLEGTLNIDQTLDIEFEVPENTPFLEVSLAWSDVPALGNVTPTLVNDLNLVLISPANLGYQPWVLSPSSPGTAAQPGTDSVNVCEKVRVANPIAGTWRARVFGEINSGDVQSFALASNLPLVNEWTHVHGTVHLAGEPGVGLNGSVLVQEDGVHALTEGDGSYSLFVPRDAAYSLLIRAYGYTPQTLGITANVADILLDFPMTAVAGDGTIHGTVEDQNGEPLEGVAITYSFPNFDIPSDLSNIAGEFTRALPGSNSYVVRAALGVVYAEQTVDLTPGQTTDVTFVLQDTRYSPVGPDAGGYYCYEVADTGHAPEFAYTSIAPAAGGPGTLIGPGAGNDWILTVALPFNARFYGVVTGGLSVSADGWIGFGTVAGGTQPWTNSFIPNDVAPNNIVCLFWDDLYPYHPSEGGQIAYYYDEPNGRFIVEYYQVSHFDPVSNKVTAQFVLYSPAARPTTTGDSEFEIVYSRFDYDGPDSDQDATLGIENGNGTTGLMVLFDGIYDQNQFAVDSGSVLRYTTGPIIGNGTIRGQITAIPATDLSGATLRLGALAFSPEVNGSFSLSNFPAGVFRLEVELAGYENLLSEQFSILPDDTTTVNMTVYRLDPPTDLAGQFYPQEWQIDLAWNAPTWNAAQRNDGGSALDELSGYKVYVQGRGVVGQPTDTFFVYTPPTIGAYRIWVTSVYDGGESDSSNIVQFIVTDADDAPTGIPTELYLLQNYPNPFNPTTSIAFGLPTESEVRLSVFDIQGRLVANLVDSQLPAGHHRVNFNAAGLGSGVYFYRLDTNNSRLIGKMMLLR